MRLGPGHGRSHTEPGESSDQCLPHRGLCLVKTSSGRVRPVGVVAAPQSDPAEQNNLVEKEAAVTARMQWDLDSLVAAFAQQSPATPPHELTPEMRELLEGLGYLTTHDQAVDSDDASDGASSP